MKTENSFQMLIDDPLIALYTKTERFDSAVVISADCFASLIQAFSDAADVHSAMRCERIIAKSETANYEKHDQTFLMLTDSHFRKQQRYGLSHDAIKHKIVNSFHATLPIDLVGLMFTRKNICPLKRSAGDESVVDLAEIISLIHLNSFAKSIARFHTYGTRFNILGEGARFRTAFSLEDEVIRKYQAGILFWIQKLKLSHLCFFDYEKFLEERLSVENRDNRKHCYEKALCLYNKRIAPLLQFSNMNLCLKKAIQQDPVTDSLNPRNNFVPLWDSIKHSISYPSLTDYALAHGLEYETLYRRIFQDILKKKTSAEDERLRQFVLQHSWSAAVEHNAQILGDVYAQIDTAMLVQPFAFRTTVNPKPNSEQIGIYTGRETSSRVQPWHGMAYLTVRGATTLVSTVLTKFEIESKGGVPVHIDSKSHPAFFYASPEAVSILRKTTPLSVSMCTR